MDKKERNEEVQSRREFFKNAAKGALPILGLVMLNSPIFANTLKAVGKTPSGCNRDGCSSFCSHGCTKGCEGGGVIRVARVIVIGPVVDRVGVCVGIVAASLVAILAKGNVVVCAQR